MGHRLSIEERLARYTIKSDGCWLWVGAKSHGYGVTSIAGRFTNVHRVVYELANGTPPEQMEIDHICRNRGCVRLEHLRALKTSENQQNRGTPKNNTSGERGVVWRKDEQRWEARVKLNGKVHSAGRFKHEDFDAAVAAVRALRARLHPYSAEASQQKSK